MRTRPKLLPLLIPLLAAPAAAQQFQHQPGLIPGPARWSEGVEAADVDRDGDLDLFFADGEGFSGPSVKRQNVLVVNQLAQTGSLAFTDESVARLGVHVSYGKGVTTADVDADGWIDALFVHAFNADAPFLYVNRGGAQPGFFDEEGAARGFTTPLNASSAQFGDLDDDGDLDVIVCDSGASLLGGAGGRPRFYRNDGSGHFTEDAASLSAPIKRAHMDVQLVDVDGDWDLDFFGANRASNSGGNHYLMLNDGSGQFSDASSLVPASSSSTYEAEIGDLDGDKDLDLFFVSLSGFSEGAVKNELVEGGSLSFTAQPALPGSYDDNEISLCDYDNDGDLDAFVGSLSFRERIWRNDGGFAFTGQHTEITSVSDSTLDMTHADLDKDGDYDVVTAQGESNAAQWANKVYLNTGGPDTLPPVVEATHDVVDLSDVNGPWIAKAKVRDQVIDDGKDYVTAEAAYAVTPSPLSASVTIQAGGFNPPILNVVPGTTVTWTNGSGVPQTVTSATAPYTYDSTTIAPGGTYSRTFVRPGTYDYASVPGGLTGQVTVPDGGTILLGGIVGGGIWRFPMTGDASSPTARLAYELYFTDSPGNVTVTEPVVVAAPGAVGTKFCSGDGSGTACPCLNQGAPGHGCANSVAMTGAELTGSGSSSIAAGSLVLSGSTLAAFQPGLYFQGDNAIAGGAGAVFGDGLRCAGGNVLRLQVVTADAAGSSSTSVDVAAAGGALAGQTKRYQLWYRDPVGGPCGSGFNLTNGLEVTWAP